jgi:hypothetical protein
VSNLTNIFLEYRAAYLEKYDQDMLPSHKRALHDIVNCRTESLGGQVWFCEDCSQYHYSFHSCRNRHCPTCQNEGTDQWIGLQRELLLPTIYFMATFTLPDYLRWLARSNQKMIYNILFRTSAEALQELALDPRFIGGKIGMIGVLQTWTKDLLFHPHIHYLIPGGGLSDDGKKWLKAKGDFLMHYQPLSELFKGKFRDAIKKTELFDIIPQKVWQQQWVVNVQSVGNGEATIKYLAPYIFRVAISNSNILSLENGVVTYRFKDSESSQYRLKRLPVLEFIHNFLQHVLPRGFVKVRYFGFLATKKRKALNNVKELLGILYKVKENKPKTQKPFKCPNCGKEMKLFGEFSKNRAPPQFEMVRENISIH